MLILIAVFFVILLLLGFPILIALGIPALIYSIVKELPASLMAYSMFQSLNSFPLVSGPLFILMGSLINEFGETELIYDFARLLLKKAKGYSAKVNVLVSLIFAGISGSAVADIGGLGQIEIKAMEEEGFSKEYSCALTAASSIVGPIFPPSIPLVIYAVTAEVSTLKALLAGMIPAILITVLLYIFVNYQITQNTNLSSNFNHDNDIKNLSMKKIFFKAFPILLLIPLITFSMLFGILSPSEAGAGAIIYVIILVIIKGKFSFAIVKKSLIYTFKNVSTIFIVIAIASFFTKVLTLERFPQMLTSWLIGISDNPIIILLLINLILLIVGMFMETVSAIVILTPILLSVANSIGVDPFHLGIILVYNLEIGMFTPPFAVGVYTVSSIGEAPPEKVFKELIPLYFPLLIALLLITFIPQLSLFIPKLLK